jgi:hypothetical protein
MTMGFAVIVPAPGTTVIAGYAALNPKDDLE